jgi:NAD(P)-dependent dehydrogenase (short-subunit alcohol dehydrogenase family)
VTLADLKSDFEVNTIGPIVLYQAFVSLLLSSDQPGGPKFVIVSSLLAQIKDSMPYEYEAYGISKAGANFVAKKVDQMNPGIVGFPIS